MISTSPKIKVRLFSGRALVCFADAVKRKPLANSLADLVEDLDAGRGLYLTYPNRTYIRHGAIECIEAADPAEPIGWSGGPVRDDGDTVWQPPVKPAEPLGLPREQRNPSDIQQFADSVGANRRRIDLDTEGRRRRPGDYDLTGDVIAND